MSETTTQEVCEYCKKPFIIQTHEAFGQKYSFAVPQCTCEEERRKKLEAAEAERNRMLRVKALNIPPMYANYWLKDLTCEHVPDAELFVGGFKPHRKGVFLWGPNGNGKTTLSAVICKELVYRGYRGLFTSMTAMLYRMEEGVGAARAQNVKRILQELRQYDIVVFDDYFRENYTELRLQNMFQIIDTLYTWNITTLMSANPESVNRAMNLPELEAIKDRMVQMMLNWEFKAPSFRRAKQ